MSIIEKAIVSFAFIRWNLAFFWSHNFDIFNKYTYYKTI